MAQPLPNKRLQLPHRNSSPFLVLLFGDCADNFSFIKSSIVAKSHNLISGGGSCREADYSANRVWLITRNN